MNMQKAYSPSKLVQKISFVSNPLSILTGHSSNGWKNLLFAFVLLLIASCKDKETEKKVTSIAITPSSPSVAVGLTQQLTATIEPADATKKDLTWISDDPLKATVDATGKVTGIAKGSAVITVAATNGVKATVTINITSKVTSVAIAPANPSVGIGKNLTLTAAVLPADAPQAVTWTSSDPTKATVDASTGAATGIALGTTTITATATDGSNLKESVTLTVRVGSADASVSAITLGDENFNVAVPAEGVVATLDNAPHTVASDIKNVKVNITAVANASIKIGTAVFTSGNTVDFSSPVTFTVTAEDGTTVKSYRVGITAYNAVTNPYGIYTVKHLAAMAKGLSASYLLKNNIDLPNADAAGAVATGISDYAEAGWLPLGTASAFTGAFDGGNFSINNFYVNRITADNAGLFAKLGKAGSIKNLGVNGVTSGTAVIGKSAGILAGLSEGTIDKCYATGNVSSPQSSSSESYAGGLVGWIRRGAVSNSHAAGSVSSSNYYCYAGGLVGYNEGKDSSISNSYATGSVSAPSYAGGLVGRNYDKAAIRNSHATGSVSSSQTSNYSDPSYAGGLAGVNANGIIRNSYAAGNVSSSHYSASSYAGGLVGFNAGYGEKDDTVIDSYATGNVSASASSSYAGGLAGGSLEGRISNSYATGTVSASASGTYALAGGLVASSGRSHIINSYATGNVSSTSTSTSASTPASSSSAGGLVGSNGSYSNISNSYATGSVSSTSASASSSAGGLAGGGGTISTISNSYATGSVSSTSTSATYAGGLVGSDDGATHTNCYRNSDAVIKKNNADATPNDASTAGITAKTKAYMQTAPFKGDLNGVSGTAWGRNDGKNDKLPFIIGVGVGG